jgi:hypothetical protein
MDDKQDKLFDTLVPMWADAFKGRRYDEAMLIGFLSFITFKQMEDKQFTNEAMTWLSMTIEGIRGVGVEIGEPICSFCGRGKQEADLVAGNAAFICSTCSDMTQEIFKARPKESFPE